MKPGALGRGFRTLLAALALSITFVLGTVAGVALHLDTPPGRRVLGGVFEKLLGGEFQGSFEIAGIERVSSGRVVASEVRVKDPEGRLVLRVERLRARADVVAIVKNILFGDGSATIVVDHVRAERASVVLVPDARTGEPTLARAFTPKPRPPRPAGAAPARPVRLSLPAIEVGRGDVRGSVVGLPPFEADLAGVRGSVQVTPEVVAVDAPRFAAKIRGLLEQELRAVGSFHMRGTEHFWTSLDGYVGELQFGSVARLDGKRLEATLDVPEARPDVVRTLLPDWPLVETVVLHASVSGDLPRLRGQARASVGGAELVADGGVEFERETRVELDVTGRDVDLRAVWPNLPETRIAARTRLVILAQAGGVTLELDGTTEPLLVAGVPLPGSRFAAKFAGGVLEGTATLHERGMPLEARFVVRPGGKVELEAHAPRFRLEAVPRLAELGGRGALSFDAKARIEDERVNGTFSLDAKELTFGTLRAGRVQASGRAAGPLNEPQRLQVNAEGTGERVALGVFAFDTLAFGASGSLSALTVTASARDSRGLDVAAKTKLTALRGTHLHEVELSVARAPARIVARAARVDVVEGTVEVDRAVIEGAGGTVTGSGRYRPGLLEVSLHGRELDLAVVARVLGLPPRELAGLAHVDAEVSIARDVRRGTLDFGVQDAAVGPLLGVTLDAGVDLNGDAVSGEALMSVRDTGSARASFELAVPGSLLDEKALRKTTGRVDVGLERLELSRVLPYLPEAWGLRELGGALVAQVTLMRNEAGATPSLNVLAATDGLSLVWAGAEPGAKPRELRGVEAQVGANLDATNNVADASLRLTDSHGLLISSSGRVELDVASVFAAPARALRELRSRPLALSATVDRRPLDTLPELVRPRGLSGVLSAEAIARGTLDAPVLAAKLAVLGLGVGEAAVAKPVDLCGRVQYDPAARRVGVGAEVHLQSGGTVCGGQRVAVATAAGALDVEALARGERGYAGDAQLALEGLPLELLGPLAASGMTGLVSGRVALAGSGELPQLSARLSVEAARVRGMALGSGQIDVRSDGRDASARVRLARGDGSLDGEARAGVEWGGALPALDRTRPVSVVAAFRNVDAGVLDPVVGDVLAELGGRLDGEARLALVPRPNDPERRFTGDVTGKVSLDEGSFQIAGLGMRLSRVKFVAEAKRVGARTVIAIRELSAASRSRYPNVSATADVYLDGISLERVRANANLSRVPLLIEGVSQATLTGSASMELERDAERMQVSVQVPELTAELPRSTGRDVISLEANRDIEILQPVAEPRRLSGDAPLEWQLVFDLGQRVKVKRADLEIPLRGRPVITLAESVDVTGDLQLNPGGRVQLLGKAFVIETGEIHFDTGEPSNPHIQVLASWNAPEGTTVYVEIRGTLREATLRLESDPPRPEAEIQALLLGGGSEGGGDAQAAGIGYGADLLGGLLADTPLRNIQLRAGTERSVDDRSYSTTGIAIPLSDELWFEGAYKNLETTDPTEREGTAVSGTINWRFRKNWSLRTEIGTIGTGLDMLWQYRY